MKAQRRLWLYAPAIVLIVWAVLTALGAELLVLGKVALAVSFVFHAWAEVGLHYHRKDHK